MDRPTPSVRLEPITDDNVKAVFELQVAPGQEQFVAPNAWSLAEAFANDEYAWARAIVRDDEVVGFLMLDIDIDLDSEQGRPFSLWRMMIGADLQHRGLGTAALAVVVDEVRSRGGTELFPSWVPAEGGPGPFYLASALSRPATSTRTARWSRG